MTPEPLSSILQSRWALLLARVLVTLPYWESALMRLLDVRGGEAEMSHFGLTPAWAFNWATLGVQAIGSALVISNRWTWLGAGALGVFTVLTIPIAHAFWTMSGQSALEAHHVAVEHMGMIGGLILVSILANRSDGLLEG